MKLFVCLILLVSFSVGAYAQKNQPIDSAVTTSVKTDAKDLYADNSSYIAKRTAMKSAMIPGWGQYVNGQYIKIPVIYAALGVLGYFVYDNYTGYKEATEAYLYRIDLDPETESPRYKNSSTGYITSSRKYYRQYLDYSVLGVMAIYALNILDAAVFAHLLKFDISNSVSFTPGVQIPNYGISPKPTVGLTFHF